MIEGEREREREDRNDQSLPSDFEISATARTHITLTESFSGGILYI